MLNQKNSVWGVELPNQEWIAFLVKLTMCRWASSDWRSRCQKCSFFLLYNPSLYVRKEVKFNKISNSESRNSATKSHTNLRCVLIQIILKKKDLANSSDNALYILRERGSEHSGAFVLVLGTDHLLKRKQKNILMS